MIQKFCCSVFVICVLFLFACTTDENKQTDGPEITSQLISGIKYITISKNNTEAKIFYAINTDIQITESCQSAHPNTLLYSNTFSISETSTIKAVTCLFVNDKLEKSDITIKKFEKYTDTAAYAQNINFGKNPGELLMHMYVPATAWRDSPVLLKLHGCGGGVPTGIDDSLADPLFLLAEKFSVIIVFPEQTAENNSKLCFHAWDSSEENYNNDDIRDQGEALSIKNMIDYTKSLLGSDKENNIFIAGHSAGAAFTAVMVATYPEMFSGAAINAGIPYQAYSFGNWTNPGAQSAFRYLEWEGIWYDGDTSFIDITPDTWGNLVRNASPYSTYPKMMFSHGVDSDGVYDASTKANYEATYNGDAGVHSLNLRDLLKQWTNVFNIPNTPSTTEYPLQGTSNVEQACYKDSTGNTLIQVNRIYGFEHWIPTDLEQLNPILGTDYIENSVTTVTGFHWYYQIFKFFGIAE